MGKVPLVVILTNMTDCPPADARTAKASQLLPPVHVEQLVHSDRYA